MAHLNEGLESPPERGLPLSHEAVLESLQWPLPGGVNLPRFSGHLH
jgi:hypothetical protein